jgi:hypothetical protein
LYNKLILNINKSLILIAILLGTHAGALSLALAVPIALGLKIGLVMLVVASLWWQWRQNAGVALGELRLEDDGTCIQSVNGEQRRYRLTRAIAHAGFVRLTLQRAGERTRTQLIPRDAVEPEVYRDLRARIVQRRLPVPDKTPA